MPAIPRFPPLWRESRIGLEAAALRRSPVFDGLGRPARRAPPGPADPRLHGGRPVARHARRLAAAQRLLHAPHRHPRQLRLLRGGLPPPRGAARAHGRAPRRARRRHRPEPRRRVREGARRAAAGARPGHRHARLAKRLPARHPPARARPGRPRERARHRARAGDVLDQLPAREVLLGVPRRARGPVPRGRRLRRRLLQERRHRAVEVLPRPGGRRARRGLRLALRHGRQRPGLPRRRGRAPAFRAIRCWRTICLGA